MDFVLGGYMKRILTLLGLLLLLSACLKNPLDIDRENALVVGMECNYAPFNWTTLDQSNTSIMISAADYCDGYDVVIASRIANDLGKKLVIKKIAWDGLEPALSSNEIDAIIAGMSATPKRAESVNFTKPYYESEMVMIVKKDSKYVKAKDIQDFSGAKILGQLNTTYDEVIDQIKNVKHATPLATYPLMLVALQSGEVDGLTAELPVAMGIVGSNDDLTYVKFDSGKGFEADVSVSIAVAKNQDELLKKIQASLDKISPEERNKYMFEAVKNQPASE